MSTSRTIGNAIAMLGLFVASLLPPSPLEHGLLYLAVSYIFIDILLRARAGYLRRRPHWTRVSWRHFLIACSVPAGALVVFVSMMAAFERRLPIVGAARSTARGIWTVGMMGSMGVGVGGLVVAIAWLAQGDPSRQFALPRWLTRGPRAAA